MSPRVSANFFMNHTPFFRSRTTPPPASRTTKLLSPVQDPPGPDHFPFPRLLKTDRGKSWPTQHTRRCRTRIATLVEYESVNSGGNTNPPFEDDGVCLPRPVPGAGWLSVGVDSKRRPKRVTETKVRKGRPKKQSGKEVRKG